MNDLTVTEKDKINNILNKLKNNSELNKDEIDLYDELIKQIANKINNDKKINFIEKEFYNIKLNEIKLKNNKNIGLNENENILYLNNFASYNNLTNELNKFGFPIKLNNDKLECEYLKHNDKNLKNIGLFNNKTVKLKNKVNILNDKEEKLEIDNLSDLIKYTIKNNKIKNMTYDKYRHPLNVIIKTISGIIIKNNNIEDIKIQNSKIIDENNKTNQNHFTLKKEVVKNFKINKEMEKENFRNNLLNYLNKLINKNNILEMQNIVFKENKLFNKEWFDETIKNLNSNEPKEKKLIQFKYFNYLVLTKLLEASNTKDENVNRVLMDLKEIFKKNKEPNNKVLKNIEDLLSITNNKLQNKSINFLSCYNEFIIQIRKNNINTIRNVKNPTLMNYLTYKDDNPNEFFNNIKTNNFRTVILNKSFKEKRKEQIDKKKIETLEEKITLKNTRTEMIDNIKKRIKENIINEKINYNYSDFIKNYKTVKNVESKYSLKKTALGFALQPLKHIKKDFIGTITGNDINELEELKEFYKSLTPTGQKEYLEKEKQRKEKKFQITKSKHLIYLDKMIENIKNNNIGNSGFANRKNIENDIKKLILINFEDKEINEKIQQLKENYLKNKILNSLNGFGDKEKMKNINYLLNDYLDLEDLNSLEEYINFAYSKDKKDINKNILQLKHINNKTYEKIMELNKMGGEIMQNNDDIILEIIKVKKGLERIEKQNKNLNSYEILKKTSKEDKKIIENKQFDNYSFNLKSPEEKKHIIEKIIKKYLLELKENRNANEIKLPENHLIKLINKNITMETIEKIISDENLLNEYDLEKNQLKIFFTENYIDKNIKTIIKDYKLEHIFLENNKFNISLDLLENLSFNNNTKFIDNNKLLDLIEFSIPLLKNIGEAKNNVYKDLIDKKEEILNYEVFNSETDNEDEKNKKIKMENTMSESKKMSLISSLNKIKLALDNNDIKTINTEIELISNLKQQGYLDNKILLKQLRRRSFSDDKIELLINSEKNIIKNEIYLKFNDENINDIEKIKNIIKIFNNVKINNISNNDFFIKTIENIINNNKNNEY